MARPIVVLFFEAVVAVMAVLAAGERRNLYDRMTLNTFAAPGNQGSVSYWETQTGYDCNKPSYSTSTSTWTANGDYALVVLKGASSSTGRTLFYGVKQGDALPSQYGNLRDVIACEEDETTTTVAPCLAEKDWCVHADSTPCAVRHAHTHARTLCSADQLDGHMYFGWTDGCHPVHLRARRRSHAAC